VIVRSAGTWNITAFAGKHFSAELIDHFISTIIKEYDPRPRLATNAVPKLLMLGRYDYNIPYREWDSEKDDAAHDDARVRPKRAFPDARRERAL
jgi:hypothetical protein